MNDSDLPIKLIKSKFPEDIPDAYIKGYVEFYKLKFKITPDVLIPRPETELLVDEVLKFSLRSNNKNLTILDIGTGSGNIAILLAKNLPRARIFATDVSESALEVARENAKRHRVENKIFFLQSDLLQNIQRSLAKVSTPNIIVANLPYIPTSRIDYLDPSVKDFEPRVALDGGPDGFDLYRKLFQQIKDKFLHKYRGVNVVHPRGVLGSHLGIKLIVCEIDDSQSKIAISEAQKKFPKAKVEVKKDLVHKPRMLLIYF